MHCAICFIGCHPVLPQEERAWGQKRENQGEKVSEPKGGREEKGTDSCLEARKNGRKPHGGHETGKGKTVICRVGSERSPCPLLRCPLMGQEEDLVWKTPGGVALWDIIIWLNISRQIFSLTLVLCVVGRFACQVPTVFPTRTAIPERFFTRKPQA